MDWLTGAPDWSALLVGGAIASLVFLAAMAGGLFVTMLVLVKMPAHYFCDHHVRDIWVDRHPVVRAAGRVAKNVLGALLVVAGAGLTLPGVPGPGLLTILIGMTLVDFPGKRRWERWLIGRPPVLRAVNRLRRRYGKPPIAMDCR